MYIFGGILELTHELNDLCCFDFETKKFSSNSETAIEEEGAREHEIAEKSPTLAKSTTMSPMKRNKTMMASQSPSRSPTKKRMASPGATKMDETQGGKREGLSSPTSVRMTNSFIIKNADESFETNSKLIPKNKNRTMVAVDSPKQTSFVEGNRPTPRDGHSAVVDDAGFMYVFGGDRHHMPFNDLYMIKLE